MDGDSGTLRWLALAIAQDRVSAALAALNGERGLAQLYPRAAIVRLYPDGRQDRFLIAQLELLLAPARVAGLAQRFRAAGVLAPAADHAILIGPQAGASQRDCLVLPAPAGAPYAQVIRWRGPRRDQRGSGPAGA